MVINYSGLYVNTLDSETQKSKRQAVARGLADLFRALRSCTVKSLVYKGVLQHTKTLT